ncbi:terminase large subunit domain-containing protein [Pantoea ananatis]|uniref:terminase large subunit domain-containing protein n=1 Tax=Pantoea ananas TaxID=553 RepID=UPI000E2656B1|nr:terminase family protein [Pantoea ananatis]REC90888.1 terminase family protein [Pantoea ananatis]
MQPTPLTLSSDACFYSGAKPFEYQLSWNAEAQGSCRVLTKIRQAGADWFFSLEALADAITSGRNQIFIGCSKGASLNNKNFITSFMNSAGSTLKKNIARVAPRYIELTNGATLWFIDPESYVAGISGNVYVSEYAWADDPVCLVKFAESLSTHKRHHATYFTTASPSVPAYETFKSLTSSAETQQFKLTVDDPRLAESPLITENWINYMKSNCSFDVWRMLFMCEWPQAKKEQAA